MILAHLGGLPIQESLVYLVPPIAVVGWIWVLGRRAHDDDPEPPEAFDDEDGDGDGAGETAGATGRDRPV